MGPNFRLAPETAAVRRTFHYFGPKPENFASWEVAFLPSGEKPDFFSAAVPEKTAFSRETAAEKNRVFCRFCKKTGFLTRIGEKLEIPLATPNNWVYPPYRAYFGPIGGGYPPIGPFLAL